MATLFEQIFGNGRDGVGGLLGNPAFMVGSGLLSNQGNPWGGALQGLAAAQGYKLSEAKMKKEAEQEQRLAEAQAMQMKAMQDAQKRQETTQGLLTTLNIPQVREAYSTPEMQAVLRPYVVANADPAALEQAGILAPLPKPMEMTAEGKNYQLAKSDPGFAEWMKQNQAGVNPGGLFAPTIVRNADGTFSAWQPGNKPGMPPVLTPLPGNPINSDVELAALLARERASAGAQGKAEGTAIAGAPEAIGKLDDAITDVTRLVADPAIDSAYGVIQGRTPTVRQGTQDFEAKRDKLIYTLGLAARGQLAGTGQISNFEQEMLLKAQSTLANPLISPQAAKEEMQRMLSWLQSKREKAALIVPNSSPSQSAPQGTTPAPQPGRVVDFNSL